MAVPNHLRWHAATHTEVLAWIDASLEGEEQERFRAEMQQAFERTRESDPSWQTVTQLWSEFATLLNTWYVTLQLRGNTEWQRQVRESEETLERGDAESMTMAELRAAVTAGRK